MKKLTSFIILSLLMLFLAGQTIDLTFTVVDSAAYVQLDSIKIMNRTQGGDTVLYSPDTVLTLYYVGVNEKLLEENIFRVFQNYPNPVAGQTTVSMYVPEKDKVSIIVTDIIGRVVVKSERLLDKGKHAFRFTPGNMNLYFFTAIWQGNASSIKMICTSTYSSGGTARLDYSGDEPSSAELKSTTAIEEFVFNPGDELLYIGYTDTLQSGMLDTPVESTTYTIQFATNIPCPGMPTVEYEGQVYNTIQIFSQCWMKENLNVGMMIPGEQEMSDNDTIEKYCYNNNINNCSTYGGLYQWNEIMQYTTQQGIQGICPPGWHVPSDEEWKILEGTVDSQYGVGDPVWDHMEEREYNAGKNMKSTSGWYSVNNGTDLYGFTALPGGFRYTDGNFYYLGKYGYWCSSTEISGSYALRRYLYFDSDDVHRYHYWKTSGFPLRCLKD